MASDWNKYYLGDNKKDKPWHYEALDDDLAKELSERQISIGSFLDVGCGLGSQAIHLAKMGFQVSATDVSETAIEHAKLLSNDVKFMVDNVLNSKLEDNAYDYIFDRGCLHVFDTPLRAFYLKTIKRILKSKGTLFLKCLSDKGPKLKKESIPYLISRSEVMDLFEDDFEIVSIKDTLFQGHFKVLPKALFAVLKKN